MAAAPSSLFGIRDEDQLSNQLTSPPSSSAPVPAPKKRRNLPGSTPYPDAEVIALSPKTLMATNRFLCEVCNKGFQREQNLQLHRRGHNLPWKLKQKNPNEVRRRRVYLCPEPTCAHHDPSRALGDLTGIKKHFCRKHGEKKWKCDKCSKRYAVQSDWKAHSKVCGTREYRCDCGTLFSRRDSFITHRAFCDALAQESTRLPTGLSSIGSHLYGNNTVSLGLSQLSSQISNPSPELAQFDHLMYPTGSSHDFNEDLQSHHSMLQQQKPNFHGLMQLPNFLISNSSSASSLSNNSSADHQFNNGEHQPTTLFSGNQMSSHAGGRASSLYSEQGLPQMSATALLQKAAQMGATTSNNGGSLLRGYSGSSSIGLKPPTFGASFGGGDHTGGESLRSHIENPTNLQDIMNSISNGSAGVLDGSGSGGGGWRHERDAAGFGGFGHGYMDEAKLMQRELSVGGMGGTDGMTRDFLGVGSMVASMGRGMTQRELDHGIEIGCLETEMKSPPSSGRSFGPGGNSQQKQGNWDEL